MRELTREMQAILEAVREEGATGGELERVAQIQRRRLESQLQRNRYWLEQLELYHRLGLPVDRIGSPYPAEPLTAADLREAAAAYVPKDTVIHITQMPAKDVEPPAGLRRGTTTAGPAR